ncbi:dihydropteroate synthase [bacterium]|nr:dihydropteroate synthase [bacterium]
MTGNYQNFQLDCRGKIIRLDGRTRIMGILNVTPDSFSDGGQYTDPDRAVERGLEIEREGADILDIGGESTRPGAESVNTDTELARIIPVIGALSDRLTIPISVDTRKARVAKAAVDAGASMINDISGLLHDPEMPGLVADLDVPVVLMHSRDDPSVMQSHVDYVDIISDIYTHLEKCVENAVRHHIDPSRIMIDPGIGFGKTVTHNFQIIKHLDRFYEMGFPVLIGVSRKSFIGRTLDADEHGRLMGTAAAVAACVLNGVHMVRVHDVPAMKQVTIIAEHIRQVP